MEDLQRKSPSYCYVGIFAVPFTKISQARLGIECIFRLSNEKCVPASNMYNTILHVTAILLNIIVLFFFSTTAALEIYKLDMADPGLRMEVAGSVQTDCSFTNWFGILRGCRKARLKMVLYVEEETMVKFTCTMQVDLLTTVVML